jgi:hypothetical protein
MKYRKLRIAWSVGWGVLCLLLIVLWFGSFFYSATLHLPISSTHVVEFWSVEGRMSFFRTDSPQEPRIRRLVVHSGRVESWLDYELWRHPHQISGREAFGFGIWNDWSALRVDAPCWFVTLIVALIGALPWMRFVKWRFSLRTLLIGMTVAAAVLGAVVYGISKG